MDVMVLLNHDSGSRSRATETRPASNKTDREAATLRSPP